MARILVSGLINIETNVAVDGFPVPYHPVRYPFFGVKSCVSGVGYNVAKALRTLGDDVRFASLVGSDPFGDLVMDALRTDRLRGDWIRRPLAETPQSVILVEPGGRRQINVDLKDIQERPYPREPFEQAAENADLLVLCNINFSRPYLEWGRLRGIPIATDVHCIGDLDDDYDRAFMAAADVLFMSDEHLPCPPGEWAARVQARFGTRNVVIGLGAQGALLLTRDHGEPQHVPAVQTGAVVNTIGAGDALFSAFVHGWARGLAPLAALRRAVVFASWKIRANGAAHGFVSHERLEELYQEFGGG